MLCHIWSLLIFVDSSIPFILVAHHHYIPPPTSFINTHLPDLDMRVPVFDIHAPAFRIQHPF
jgi:hypothetical protein